MKKSKNGMHSRTITYLLTDTFLAIVIESTFSSLPLGRYQLPLATLNRYLSRCNKNFCFPASSGNISVARHIYSQKITKNIILQILDSVDSKEFNFKNLNQYKNVFQ